MTRLRLWGYSIYPCVGRCGPVPHTLTLFKTKIADVPTLFKTEFRFLIPCLRHLTRNHTLCKTIVNKKICCSLVRRTYAQAVHRSRKDNLFKTKIDKIDTLIKRKNDKIDTLIREKMIKSIPCLRQKIPQNISWLAARPHLPGLTLYRIAFAPVRKPYRIGLLFTHKSGDFGAISETVGICAAPVSKVERKAFLPSVNIP